MAAQGTYRHPLADPERLRGREWLEWSEAIILALVASDREPKASSSQEWAEAAKGDWHRLAIMLADHVSDLSLKSIEVSEDSGNETLRIEVASLRRLFLAKGWTWPVEDLPPSEPEQQSQPRKTPTPKPASRWPWGIYETKLLIELAEAARHFWTEYKPGLPATAPTNDEVRDWLMRRGVPQRKAEVMAQILRADDLPPGPHVNK
jgi:hypothetical protein